MAIVVLLVGGAEIEIGQDVQLPCRVIPLFPALLQTKIRGECVRRGGRNVTDASLIFQSLYLIP